MSLRKPWSWFGVCLVGVLLWVSYGSAIEPSGSLSLALVLQEGAEVDRVDWQITGNGIDPMTGSIDIPAPSAPIAIDVPGIAPGDGYQIDLSASSDDGNTTCQGPAAFNAAEGEVTEVHVMLRCTTDFGAGQAQTQALVNSCAYLTWVTVSPLQTSVGNNIDVFADAFDPEGDPIEYLWTGTGGSFADPTAQTTTYTCEQVGDQSIGVTVSDDGFQSCLASYDTQVTCVLGAGCTPDGGAQSAGPVTNRPCGPGSCSAMEVCVDGSCQPGALIFVSTSQSDADLEGPRGADTTCANLAAAAGLGGYWFSWTSDSCTSPDKRFEKSTLPYYLVDGTLVSSSWARLTMDPPPAGEPPLDHSIDIDENGTLVATKTKCGESTNPPAGCHVWTNTTVDGHVAALGNNDGCSELTDNDSALGGMDVGNLSSVFTAWTLEKTSACGTDNARIYCFEQSTANPIP